MSENCIHIHLTKQVGPMDGGAESKRYVCQCGENFTVEVQRIGVQFGSPRKVGEDGAADDKNYYASYANHCAIQRQIPLTFPAWKKQGKVNAPNMKVSSVPVGEQKQEEGV